MPSLAQGSDSGEDSLGLDETPRADGEGGEKDKNSRSPPPPSSPSPLETPPTRSGGSIGAGLMGLDTSTDPVLRSIAFGLSQLSQANRRDLLQQLFGEIPEFQSTPLSASSIPALETPSK